MGWVGVRVADACKVLHRFAPEVVHSQPEYTWRQVLNSDAELKK
jgi:hypothetical protein